MAGVQLRSSSERLARQREDRNSRWPYHPSDAGEDPMTIGQLAECLELNPRTIRYYERIGLMPEVERTEAGYRVYGRADERRLRFIRRCAELGMSLAEIKEALAMNERGERPCPYIAEVLERRLAEIDRSLRELRDHKREVAAALSRAAAARTSRAPTNLERPIHS